MNLSRLSPTLLVLVNWKRAGQFLLSLLAGWFIIDLLIQNWHQYSVLSIHWPWLIAAGLCMAVSKWIFSMERYHELIKQTNIHISRHQLVRMYGTGMFLNQFLPGGFGGDLYKIWHLRKNCGATTNKAGLLTLKDRIYGLIAIIHILTIIVSWIIYPIRILAISLGLLISIILLYQLNIWFRKKDGSRYNGLSLYAHSLLIQFFQCCMIVCILLAFGCSDYWVSYLLLFLISSVAIALPITIGGIGIREFTFALGAASLNMNEQSAVLVGFCSYCLSLLIALPGCLFLFSTHRTTE